MKKVLLTASVLALFSIPALAQSTMGSGGSMNQGQTMQPSGSGMDMPMRGKKAKRMSSKSQGKKMTHSKKMMRSQGM